MKLQSHIILQRAGQIMFRLNSLRKTCSSYFLGQRHLSHVDVDEHGSNTARIGTTSFKFCQFDFCCYFLR